MNKTSKTYAAPSIERVGSLREFTQAKKNKVHSKLDMISASTDIVGSIVPVQ